MQNGGMGASQPVVNQVFRWKKCSKLSGTVNSESFCHLRIYQQPGSNVTAIVVSDIVDEQIRGEMIQCPEQLVRLIVQEFRLNPNEFVYIEHQPQGRRLQLFLCRVFL